MVLTIFIKNKWMYASDENNNKKEFIKKEIRRSGRLS